MAILDDRNRSNEAVESPTVRAAQINLQSHLFNPEPTTIRKSPSKINDQGGLLRRNQNSKYSKVSDFIIKTAVNSTTKPKNKKGLFNSDAPKFYEQMT